MIEFCLACYLLVIPIQLFWKEELYFTDHTREWCSACLAASSSLASVGHFNSLFLPC